MRKDKLKHLSTLLPLVLSLSGGLASPASALELSATDVASVISEAFARGQLPTAQVALNQLSACSIRAISVNGVEYTISALQTMINRLASGEDASVMPRPTGAAWFVVEPGWASSGANCETTADTASDPQVFPVGSEGSPAT